MEENENYQSFSKSLL